MCLISQTANLGAQEQGLQDAEISGEVRFAERRKEEAGAWAFPYSSIFAELSCIIS